MGPPRLKLPPGSRILETGGYKSRSREMPKPELHRLISKRLGIDPVFIVCEYGMSELSSQAYDRVAGAVAGGFRFPSWARARIISPETGRDADEGEAGLLQILDLANVWSALAVLTGDVAVQREGGFEILGRAETAGRRGCSLMPV
jgi:hypothetical protein